MNDCYITAAETYSKFDLFLFRFFNCKRIFKKLNVSNHSINVIKIPLPQNMKEKHKKKYFTKICRYLNESDVKNICIYKLNDDLLHYYFKTEFQIINGKHVFYELFPDIVTHFSEKKGYNLNECDLVFISNNPKEVKQYVSKCFRLVKNISIYTTNPGKFESLANEFREEYGIFIHIKGKNDKVKKYNKIYINCEPDRIVDEAFFQSVNLIDIFKIYKGAFCEIILSYKTDFDAFLKENKIVKNLSFTEYFLRTQYTNIDKKTIKTLLKGKNDTMNFKKCKS